MFRRLPTPARVALDWLVTIAAVSAFVLAFEAEVAKPYRIPSASMEPTLHCARPAQGCDARFSDRVIANRLAFRFRKPHRGEIVVFHAPDAAARLCQGGGTFVKRIVGLPGEVVAERAGFVYVNGRRLAEPYVRQGRRDVRTQTWPKLRKDEYFMMGDNRNDSCDSRVWGAVSRDRLIGPVLFRYWPPG